MSAWLCRGTFDVLLSFLPRSGRDSGARLLYCSKECQKKDWKRHKGVCTAKKSARVDIAGLDKIAVLRALWEPSRVASFLAGLPCPPFHNAAARVLVQDYIDYFQGMDSAKADQHNIVVVAQDGGYYHARFAIMAQWP